MSAVLRLIEGDVVASLAGEADSSFDGMLCDPPYELSNDGKASAAWVATLPTKLQARRIRVISGHANRALTFDLNVHPQSMRATGFMGKAWDATKVAGSEIIGAMLAGWPSIVGIELEAEYVQIVRARLAHWANP